MSLQRLDDKNSDISSLITGFENLDFEELDPNVAEGFKIIFDREIPIELRLEGTGGSKEEAGTLESIKTKIMIQGEIQKPTLIKLELTSESDLFFNYIATIDNNNFGKMREDQKLNIELSGFSNLLIKMFNNSQKDPNTYFAVLFISGDGQARLDFIQNLEYKFLELLTIDFAAATEDIVRQNIMFRYSIQRAKRSFLEVKLKEVGELVKVKNPSLLLHIQKGGMPLMKTSQQGSIFPSSYKK